MTAITDQLRAALRHLTTGGAFTAQQMSDIVTLLMQSDLSQEPLPQLAGAFLCSLKTRGETPEEIFGAADCLRRHQISVPVDTPEGVLLDTCGTGGDGAHLLNISTITGIVLASLGVPIAKHGNRSVSSACGSADLLEAMGYPLLSSQSQVATLIQTTRFGFLFAPNFHPALKNLSGLRRSLGVRTMFNMLGPLVNPAGVTHQMIGVFDREIVTPIAGAAARMGLKRCLVVHGQGGLDELSPEGTTWATLAEEGRLTELEWTPRTFGADPVPLKELQGGDVARNVSQTAALLRGELRSAAAAVAMNCGACLWLVEKVSSLEEGYGLSLEAMLSGAVERYFEDCLRAAQSSWHSSNGSSTSPALSSPTNPSSH
ncbi:MAG: anthranilate phosphoribosyltransferase [Vulcanimicrobiota bacterium]